MSLVGYTNSGKSTLLKALSGDASILAEDRLFSTLDTSVRRIVLPGGGAVLFSDTVGFIRSLPPALVAAFRATLEEIREAELLLLLLDASAPEAMSTYEVIVDTLTEIECRELPRLLVLNKLDAIPPEEAESLALALRGMASSLFRTSRRGSCPPAANGSRARRPSMRCASPGADCWALFGMLGFCFGTNRDGRRSRCF